MFTPPPLPLIAAFAAHFLLQHVSGGPVRLTNIEKRSENGPVILSNFPDPCIVNTRGMWYAFATNTLNSAGVDVNVQIAQSKDFNTWTVVNNADGTLRDALPLPPQWVNMSMPNTWAPDVNELDDGTYVMYYSATTTADSSKHCIGAATSRTILGPYTPQPVALFCPLSLGGAIDAAGFKDWQVKGSGWGGNDGWGWRPDEPHNSFWSSPWWGGGRDGRRYVTYKVDGNSIGHGGVCGNTVAPIAGTPLVLQEVGRNGVDVVGPPVTMLDNNGVADDGVTEAPSLVKTAEGEYVLFFSSGCYDGPDYNVNYATASGIAGPYTRRGPLLRTGELGLYAPGGADVYWDGVHMVFHADLGTTPRVRQMYTALIDIDGVQVTL